MGLHNRMIVLEKQVEDLKAIIRAVLPRGEYPLSRLEELTDIEVGPDDEPEGGGSIRG